MTRKLYPADTLKQAQSILTAWNQIDPSLQVGTLTPEGFLAEIDTANALRERIVQLELELMNLRNQRDAACIGIWGKAKGMRAYIRGVYGDDSVQYKLAGGTPMSEKKRTRRRMSREPKEETLPPEDQPA